MADRPNEQMEDRTELRTDAGGSSTGDGGDVDAEKSRPSIRWEQLAYDLEQYGNPDPNERGEVF